MVETHHASGFWPSLYEPFLRAGSRLAEWIAPPSEASSDDGAYRIAVELPGVAPEAVELHVEGGMLTLRGEKKTHREEKDETWYFSERQYGAFSRSFRLPPDADGDKAQADMKDGVLTVTVPRRSADTARAQKIAISKG